MAKRMAKVLCTMPCLKKEINTKVNLMMTERMAKVLCTMPMEINTKVNLKMA